MKDFILAVLLFIASVFFVICFILAGITLVLRSIHFKQVLLKVIGEERVAPRRIK